jgi:hypothetical protein
MRLDPALRAVASYPLVMARLVSSPVRAVLPSRQALPAFQPDFKCPGCSYELRVAPRYACPRCAVPLGPRRLRRNETAGAPKRESTGQS